jgi:hypothetical protein
MPVTGPVTGSELDILVLGCPLVPVKTVDSMISRAPGGRSRRGRPDSDSDDPPTTIIRVSLSGIAGPTQPRTQSPSRASDSDRGSPAQFRRAAIAGCPTRRWIRVAGLASAAAAAGRYS